MSNELEVLEPESRALTVVGGHGVLEGKTPEDFIARASSYATALAKVIHNKKLYKDIQGKKYTFCEGWTTLASMCGLFPFEVSNEDIGGGVYKSVMELRSVATGQAVACASAQCGAPDEVDRNGNPIWSNRSAQARQSMAATRATSKVCRLALSWIMVLAGYAPTPAEEMDFVDAEVVEKPQRQATPKQKSGSREWDGNLKVKSGKYAGKTWAELPKGFLEWALDQDGAIKDMAAKEIGRRALAEGEVPAEDEPPHPAEELF